MVSNKVSIYSMLTFIYQIYLVMPAPHQFPDDYTLKAVGVFFLFAHDLHHGVDQLRALCIVCK